MKTIRHHRKTGIVRSRKKLFDQKVLLIFLLLSIAAVCNLFIPSSSSAQEVRENERMFRYLWSDSPRLTNQDIQDIDFLDKCNTQKNLSNENIEKIGEIISRSDLDFVVRYALRSLPSKKNLPEKVIGEVVKLAYIRNDSFCEDLAISLGRLAIPCTFPTLLHLLKHSNGYLNPALVVYRFGIESLAAIPDIWFRFARGNIKNVSDKNFIFNVVSFLFRLTASGQGIVVPYKPKLEQIELLFVTEAYPVLPSLKIKVASWAEGLKKKTKLKNSSLCPTKRLYNNFSLPLGKTDEVCSGIKFRSASLSSVLKTLFGLIDVEVVFGSGNFEETISCEIVGDTYGKIADKIMSKYGLIGKADKGFILIMQRKE